MYLEVVVAICLHLTMGKAVELTNGFLRLSTSTGIAPFVGTSSTFTITSTSTVWPTASVTGIPISTRVLTYDGIVITNVAVEVPSDAPFATNKPRESGGSSVSTTVTVVFAPVVVTPPISCSRTSFRYVTSAILQNIDNLSPTDLDAVLSQLSGVTRSSFTTNMAPGEKSPRTTSWAQVNVYLPAGIASATLASADRVNLFNCYDPRRFGCPMAESTAAIAGCPIERVKTGYPLAVDGGASTTSGGSERKNIAAASTGLVDGAVAAVAAGLAIAVGAMI